MVKLISHYCLTVMEISFENDFKDYFMLIYIIQNIQYLHNQLQYKFNPISVRYYLYVKFIY